MSKEVNIKVKVDTQDAEKSVDGLSNSVDGLGGSVGGMFGALGKGFKATKTGVKSLSLGFKGLKGAIAATGIGLLVIGLAALVSYFTQTQKGMDLVERGMNALSTTVNVIIDRFSKFGEALLSLDLGAMIDSFAGVTDEIVAEVKAVDKLTVSMQNLALEQSQWIVDSARLTAEFEKQKKASNDITLSYKERESAAIKAGEAQEKLLTKNQELLKEETIALLQSKAGVEGKAEAEQLYADVLAGTRKLKLEDLGFSESNREDLDKTNTLIARAIKLEGEFAKKTSLVEVKLNSIRKERSAAQAKNAAAKKKTDDDELKRLEKLAIAKKKALDAQNKQGEKDATANAKEAKKLEDAANALKQFRLNLAATEAIQLEAIRDNEIAAAEFRAGILLNNEELNADERILIEETLAKKKNDINNKYIKDKTDADTKALEKEKIEAAEKLQTQFDNGQLAIDTAQSVSDAISAISTLRFKNEQDNLDKRFANDSAALDAKADEEMRINGKLSANTIKERNKLDNAKIDAQNKLDNAKNKSLKRQFKVEKAFNIANIALSTAAAIAKANPIIPLMVSAGLIGAAQIAVVSATKFSPTGGDTPNIAMPNLDGNDPAGASPNDSATFSNQELFGTSVEQLGGEAGSNQIRAYVTERDISDSQNRIKIYEERATLG